MKLPPPSNFSLLCISERISEEEQSRWLLSILDLVKLEKQSDYPWARPMWEKILQQAMTYPLNPYFLGVIYEESKEQALALALFECNEAQDLKNYYLLKLFTHPKWRGRGMASRLLKEMIGDKNNAHFSLDVAVDNLQALALYAKLGFKEERVRPHFYSDGKDAYLMSLKIGLG